MQPYQQTIQKLLDSLQTDLQQGLSNKKYKKKLEKHGLNTLNSKKISSILYIFISQLNDPLTHMLFGAAAIIFLVGHQIDASIIIGILTFNALIGTVQEKRTEKILDDLQTFFQCSSLVTRDGKQNIVQNEYIVPGDIIYINAGEKIPADARIISAINLTTDESTMTGESHPVYKSAEVIAEDDIPLHEQKNILFAGTYIITGNATAVVFATGKDTQTGKIYETLETVDTNTPLKKELETLSSWILVFILIMCSTLFTIGIITRQPLIDLIVMVTALFICVIPEGLPVVLTIIFVSGAYRMAKKNVVVKRLRAIEALGKIDVIITDKTGTLTYNQLMVTYIFVDATPLEVTGSGYHIQGTVQNQHAHQTTLTKIADACVLLNDTHIAYDASLETFTVKGNPTQAAAFVCAQKINPHILQDIEQYHITYTIPFDAEYKYSAVFYERDAQHGIYMLGAPEVILPACSTHQQEIQRQVEEYVAQGYRVVALANTSYQPANEESITDYHTLVQNNFEFLGLLIISDEPRANLSAVIEEVTQAGIQIIMATGDHPETAFYIADKVGITHNKDRIITGTEFELLSDEACIKHFADQNIICARFSPQQKLRLVTILRKDHKIIATTGDGINDVPALMASDVSIAMGTSGAQLTKQTADIILLNDSFDNIIYAMQEGKAMFYALRRTLLYFLTSNASEVFVIFFALVLNIPAPLLPSQILLLNLMTDGFLDAALATEASVKTEQKITRKKQLKILDRAVMYKTLWLALPASIMSFTVFVMHYQNNLAYARTITFITLTAFQWFNAYNCRSEHQSIFKVGLFSNFWLIIASLSIFGVQILIIYTPIMQYIFQTVPLTGYDWVYAITIASTIFTLEELRKYTARTWFAS